MSSFFLEWSEKEVESKEGRGKAALPLLNGQQDMF